MVTRKQSTPQPTPQPEPKDYRKATIRVMLRDEHDDALAPLKEHFNGNRTQALYYLIENYAEIAAQAYASFQQAQKVTLGKFSLGLLEEVSPSAPMSAPIQTQPVPPTLPPPILTPQATVPVSQRKREAPVADATPQKNEALESAAAMFG